MAIKITENGVVKYENEPNIDRELFPNATEGGGSPEQIAEAVANWFEDHPVVQDVQVNGTSILGEQGVANVPKMSNSVYGVAKAPGGKNGIIVDNAGGLRIDPPDYATIKTGEGQYSSYRPIVPKRQHESVFYGLAKASGDTTQSVSENNVGTYTEEAKFAIQNMLGISAIIGPVEGTTASTGYSIGDAFLHGGALYKVTAAISSGDAIVPGTNCEQTTIIDILKGE